MSELLKIPKLEEIVIPDDENEAQQMFERIAKYEKEIFEYTENPFGIPLHQYCEIKYENRVLLLGRLRSNPRLGQVIVIEFDKNSQSNISTKESRTEKNIHIDSHSTPVRLYRTK
jgi:hypothetical protein